SIAFDRRAITRFRSLSSQPAIDGDEKCGGRGIRRSGSVAALLLYLDQNYLSGIVKRKPAFRELEPVLRAAVARGAVTVPASPPPRRESAPAPALPLLELLRQLSGGLRLPAPRGPLERSCERRLGAILERDFPERRGRASDALDLRSLALALP